MDLPYTHANNNKMGCDARLCIPHSIRKFRDKDHDICCLYKLYSNRNLRLTHIRVYIPRKDPRNNLANKCKRRLRFFVNKLHWVRREMECKGHEEHLQQQLALNIQYFGYGDSKIKFKKPMALCKYRNFAFINCLSLTYHIIISHNKFFFSV